MMKKRTINQSRSNEKSKMSNMIISKNTGGNNYSTVLKTLYSNMKFSDYEKLALSKLLLHKQSYLYFSSLTTCQYCHTVLCT